MRNGTVYVKIKAIGQNLSWPVVKQESKGKGMIELGKMQDLTVVSLKDPGAYLGESQEADAANRILLPKKQVPEECGPGDVLHVFVYRDSSDRLIATTTVPKMTLGEVARLTVRQVNRIGAFLDFGLEKDLLLPYSEQTRRVAEGDQVLAALYIDKSGRLAATMNIYPYLKTNSPYTIGDNVEGEVYQIAHNFGVFIAVDGKYSGMIPIREAQAGYQVGQMLQLRVTNVKEDGKLDLSAKSKAYVQMNDDAQAVLLKIRTGYEGRLPFNDKADPELIRNVFGLSKAAFKRAVGHLYKERLIRFEGEGIEVNEQ